MRNGSLCRSLSAAQNFEAHRHGPIAGSPILNQFLDRLTGKPEGHQHGMVGNGAKLPINVVTISLLTGAVLGLLLGMMFSLPRKRKMMNKSDLLRHQ
jgi:hypothetical protein